MRERGGSGSEGVGGCGREGEGMGVVVGEECEGVGSEW